MDNRFHYDRRNFDYAQWERSKLYPYENIVVSTRRRPLLGRITGLGWFSIATLVLAVLLLIWSK